jgi:hypothetical protein
MKKNEIHDGRNNAYNFEKDGETHTLLPLKDEGMTEENNSKVLLVIGKEFLQAIKKEEVHFSLIGKPKIILTTPI